MIFPVNIEELASYVNDGEKTVFFFTADRCGDCRFIQPFLPEIEGKNPDYRFIQVDRDAYLDLAKEWDVYGIPSLVVLEKGQEIGRLVNRDRKTKGQINEFLASMREKGSVK